MDLVAGKTYEITAKTSERSKPWTRTLTVIDVVKYSTGRFYRLQGRAGSYPVTLLPTEIVSAVEA